MQIDKPLAELQHYKPELTAPSDFTDFWHKAVQASDRQPLDLEMTAVNYPVEGVQVYDVRFNGFGQSDTRVAGWFIEPAHPLQTPTGIPAILSLHGYNGHRGLPVQYIHWALQGFRTLSMDVRGQDGDTPDRQPYPAGGAAGHMSRGLESPDSYYYKFVYLDCLRGLEILAQQANSGGIFVTGGSQGGGLTLAVAALAADKYPIRGAMPDVPFLCHFTRSLELFTAGPYQELANHWKLHPGKMQRELQTLAYFDGMNFAPLIKCPVLMSVGLLDNICPPSTGFAVFNHLKVEKELKVYPYSAHEGGGVQQDQAKYYFVRQYLTS